MSESKEMVVLNTLVYTMQYKLGRYPKIKDGLRVLHNIRVLNKVSHPARPTH